MNLQGEYQHYIEEVTGSAPIIKPVAGEEIGMLPLYLRSYYHIVKTRIFGRQVFLAIQNADTDTATPSEYAQHHRALRSTLNDEIVLVLPRIASYGRQQLVRSGIPFVVPHRQAFLPPAMVDLRERFPRTGYHPGERLQSAAQVVLLRHLLGRPTEGVSLRELAGELGYSAMTLSTVRCELESLKLSTPIQRGRSTHLAFPVTGLALWERAEPYLQDPIKVRHWVRWLRPGKNALQAGLTALAAASMVSDDELPSYAMKGSDYRTQLEKGSIVGCDGPEEAQACVECWRYDPRLLSEGPTVDRLSLYLSLRRADDERVAKAVKTLLKEMTW